MANDPQKAARRQKPFLGLPGAERVVGLLSDKWTIPVMHALLTGTKRHAELRRGIPAVSQRMLTRTLRSLERQGLVERRIHAEVPPKVEYTLTPLGRSLNGPVAEVCRWLERHGPELDGATRRGEPTRDSPPDR